MPRLSRSATSNSAEPLTAASGKSQTDRHPNCWSDQSLGCEVDLFQGVRRVPPWSNRWTSPRRTAASRPAMTARKVALVTGSSSGIGRATAHSLAAAGYDLALHGLLADQDLVDAVNECEQLGAQTAFFHGDL